MTTGRLKGLRAVVMIALAQPAGSCATMPAVETGAPRSDAIPADISAALGCDATIRGNGLGVDGTNTVMLAGYRPASLKGGPALSVFWCAQAGQKFVLAFVRDGRLTHPECPPTLTWPYAPKAALSLSGEPLPLNEFAEADRMNHTGHAWRPRARLTGKTAGPVVVDGDDSLSNEFYCHKGTWMVRVLD